MQIKTVFSIKDLENLSGIKAHTIRMWEKRYNLFSPTRTATNIRVYGSDELQRLLNVALLLKNGYKISKVANLSAKEIQDKINELSLNVSKQNIQYNNLKLAMMHFDSALFESTYKELISTYSFRQLFTNIFMPLFNEIGVLWQSRTIKPIHENFISTLIIQKILLNIEKIPCSKTNKKTFVLFLPVQEMHHIGLLYLHYEILSLGFKSIFLGNNVPIQDLKELQRQIEDLVFVSYFTIEPAKENIENYFKEIDRNVLAPRKEQFHVLGNRVQELLSVYQSDSIFLYPSVDKFIQYIESKANAVKQ